MKHSVEEKSACGESGFNYCFWAKFIIGVPALFIIVRIAGSFFENPLLQVWVGALAGIGTVYLAMKIDKMPAFSGMVIKKKD